MIWIVAPDLTEYNDLIKELSSEKFESRSINHVADISLFLKSEIPSVIVFDASGNEVAILEFCSALKSAPETKEIKIIVLSNSENEAVEIAFLETGVEDFLLKPIRISVLLKRVFLRMKNHDHTAVISCKLNGQSALHINRESYTVFLNQNLISLSRKEFELLYLMATNPGKIFTRTEIFKRVWNRITKEKDRSVDVHILRLRKKLGDNVIATHKGFGYRLAL